MIYKTGFISSIVNNKWVIEAKKDTLSYVKNGLKGNIDYLDIKYARIEKGVVWNIVRISTKSEKIHIDGLLFADAKEFKKDLEERIKNLITELITKNESSLSNVAQQIHNFLRQDRYLSHTEIRTWLATIPKIGKELSHPYFEPTRLPLPLQSIISVFIDVNKQESETLKRRNEKFVLGAIENYDYLFSILEKYPLTDEQKRAVVIDEDRNLLIAAAGSGKSSTIVAKVVYLIESGLAKHNEILVLAYNKKAQLEIEERLKKLLGITPRYAEVVNAKTFHGLGMDIMIKVDGEKPSISEFASAGKIRLAILFNNLIDNLIKSDSIFAQNWITFLTVYRQPAKDLDGFKTHKEYNEYLKEIGAYWKESWDGVRLVLKTIDGKEVKSMEELRISNWLAYSGVNYQYESRYPYSTADSSHRQYYPDFYYPEAKLYHEHFALNKYGNAPQFMRNYESGVDWKRDLHFRNGTNLIETYSSDFKDGTIFEKLKLKLIDSGVTFRPRSQQEIDTIINDAFNPENDAQLFSTFLRHFKSNNLTMPQVREKSESLPDKARATLFLDIFSSIYDAYQSQLNSNEEIDFEDQIIKSCDYLESERHTHSYKYILVDEFQDISQDRKRMIHALLDQNDEIKLFAVGDDWQSIYRFSGADIDIMTNFSDHFGVTSSNQLTKTFRSYQGIVDVASEFIQLNPRQLRKNIKANNDIILDQVSIIEYDSSNEHSNLVDEMLEKINKTARQHRQRLTVFLLGRYNHVEPQQLASYTQKYNKICIEFKTIHAAKGLEADYVILLNVEVGEYGFPSTITDDPLLHLVIPHPDIFPHAEERRLMYVALTRAKRAVYILSDKSRQSSFSTELAGIKRVSSSLDTERTNPCPECDTGELRTRPGRFGVFMGCSNYPDCDYTASVNQEGDQLS